MLRAAAIAQALRRFGRWFLFVFSACLYTLIRWQRDGGRFVSGCRPFLLFCVFAVVFVNVGLLVCATFVVTSWWLYSCDKCGRLLYLLDFSCYRRRCYGTRHWKDYTVQRIGRMTLPYIIVLLLVCVIMSASCMRYIRLQSEWSNGHTCVSILCFTWSWSL